MITIFKNITDTETPNLIDVHKVFERIRKGKSKDLVEQIRPITDKKERDKLKKQLPSICFSGEFSKRANDSCINHSGFVCIDFDHVSNLQELKTSLQWDKYTFAVFLSPSGDGLKVIVKIPANKANHKASCRALKEYYNNPCLDNFEDIARVCYESFDPSIFVNEESDIFVDLKEEIITEKQVKVSIDDDFEIFERLKKWIEKTDNYTVGNRHKFLVKFSGALNRYGVSLGNALSYLKLTYKNKTEKPDDDGFEKAIERVYATYLGNHNISYFDKMGISIDRKTGQRTSTDVFEAKELVNEIVDDSLEKIRSLVETRMINRNNPPMKQKCYLMVKKSKHEQRLVRFMTSGNVSVIKGKMKSKKTFLLSMICGVLVSNNSMGGTLYPSLPEHKRHVVFIDTEQCEYDVWNLDRKVVEMSNTDGGNFASFFMRGTKSDDIIGLIDYLLATLKTIAVIVIDQVADLVKSVNDEEKAVELSKYLDKITVENDIHVSCVIHENPAKESNKATGWLGTQLLKKAESIITVRKDPENNRMAIVSASETRGEEFDDFVFEINDNGMPIILQDFIPMQNSIV